MSVRYRFAFCNEQFEKTPFRGACRQIRALGFEGLEIAPFTLSPDPASLTHAQRAEFRQIMIDEGIEYIGLHWLLMAPPGLHITTPDESLRKRSWDFVHAMIDLSADLSNGRGANNGVLVFGSPKARSTVAGMGVREAVDVFTHELAHTAPHAESCGVKLLVEALSPDQTDVITSLSEAVAIVRQIGSPAVQTMFDTHNAISEKDPHPDLIRRYCSYIQHVHVNELDGSEPGMRDYDFVPVLKALEDLEYPGWVSVEALDFSRDPYEIAKRSIETLKAAAAPLAAKSHAQ